MIILWGLYPPTWAPPVYGIAKTSQLEAFYQYYTNRGFVFQGVGVPPDTETHCRDVGGVVHIPARLPGAQGGATAFQDSVQPCATQ